MDLNTEAQDLMYEIAAGPVCNLVDACQSMGAGCLFEDLSDDGERAGAIKILKWIRDNQYFGDIANGR